MFSQGSAHEKRQVNTEVKRAVGKAKNLYRTKIESKFKGSSLCDAWKGLKNIASNDAAVDVNRLWISIERVNEQKLFERYDFSADLLELKQSLSREGNIVIKEEVVNRLLKGININKCSGPDRIYGRTFKFCADQLSGVLRHLFQASIDQHSVTFSLENVHYEPCLEKFQNNPMISALSV